MWIPVLIVLVFLLSIIVAILVTYVIMTRRRNRQVIYMPKYYSTVEKGTNYPSYPEQQVINTTNDNKEIEEEEPTCSMGYTPHILSSGIQYICTRDNY